MKNNKIDQSMTVQFRTINNSASDWKWQSYRRSWAWQTYSFLDRFQQKVSRMIVVFRKFLILQKLMGLDPYGGRVNFCGRFIFSALMILAILLPLINVILNFRDKADLAALPSIFGCGPVAPFYLHLIVKSDRLYSLLDELQDIVNESTWTRIVCVS